MLTKSGCPDVTEDLDRSQCTNIPANGGGLGDVYEGKLQNGTVVAIKCARKHPIDEDLECMLVSSPRIFSYLFTTLEHSTRVTRMVEVQKRKHPGAFRPCSIPRSIR
jgi:predicted unusual protein kinase regulating ubiquinone biosynthesis (AarF/ABC1/UbiB family)